MSILQDHDKLIQDYLNLSFGCRVSSGIHLYQNFLILNEGKILNINKGKTTVINFNKTQLNLSDYSSKTTKITSFKK